VFSESSDVLQLNVNKKSIHDGIKKVGRSCETRDGKKKNGRQAVQEQKKGWAVMQLRVDRKQIKKRKLCGQ